MRTRIQHGGGTILLSFFCAYSLMIIPLPDWLAPLRPEWVALVLIYWCMALPNRVGVGIGWITGLLLDVLLGGLLGQHALSMSIIAYLTLKLHQRVRVSPLLQQAFSILILILLHQILIIWIQGITGHAAHTWTYWLPSLSSMLIWPAIFIVLRNLRRRYVTA